MTEAPKRRLAAIVSADVVGRPGASGVCLADEAKRPTAPDKHLW